MKFRIKSCVNEDIVNELGPVPQKVISANPGLKVNPPLDSVSQRRNRKVNHGLVNLVNNLGLNSVS